MAKTTNDKTYTPVASGPPPGYQPEPGDEPDATDTCTPIHLKDIAVALHNIQGRLATVEQPDTAAAGGGGAPQ